jgi:3,4-dihydroxy 2-butanone 4-phosphate synthase/GTP cyclohydrolase II
MVLFDNPARPDAPHFALVSRPFDADNVLVRVHSECLTGETLRSRRCDCGDQLAEAQRRVAAEGGILVYLRQEGRGIGLTEKIRAYSLQDRGLDTVDANTRLGHPVDGREYSAAAAILRDLGVRGIRLLTNNPEKVKEVAALGIPVRERVAIEIEPNETNRPYLDTKRERLGHLISN